MFPDARWDHTLPSDYDSDLAISDSHRHPSHEPTNPNLSAANSAGSE